MSPLALKQQQTITFHLLLAVVLWQLHELQNGTPALHSFIYWDVGEPTRHPCSTTGMMQDNHLLQLGVTWDMYLRELLCHREEVLSVMRIVFSESVVFHLVFWVSSSVVFVWVVFVFGVCFVSTLEDTWLFAFHLFSNNVRIADRTTRRFDDRPSLERARHELKKTKTNSKLPLLIQQDEIEAYKESLPQNKRRRNKMIRKRMQVSPALIQRSPVSRTDHLKKLSALPSPKITINMDS